MIQSYFTNLVSARLVKMVHHAKCKHQYILWVNKVSDVINFLPVLSKEQQQMYAKPSLQSESARTIAEGLPGNTVCTAFLLVLDSVKRDVWYMS